MKKLTEKILPFFPELLFLGVASGYLLFYEAALSSIGYHFYSILWIAVVLLTLFIFFTRPRKSSSSLLFPKEQLKRIEEALPHEAIKLYQGWLQYNLENCYQTHSKKLKSEERKIIVNELSQALILSFQKLLKTQIYLTLEDRNKDHATVTLVFLTVLIRYLKEKAANKVFNKSISPYREVFSDLLLSEGKKYLFREYYRLYELGSLVEETWPMLNFNSDIQSILSSVLVSKVNSVNLNQPIIQTNSIPVQNNNPIVPANPNAVANTLNNNMLINTVHQHTPAPTPNVSKVINNVSAGTSANIIINNENKDKNKNANQEINTLNVGLDHKPDIDDQSIEKINKFKQWLEKQLVRQPINQSTFFYQDNKNFTANKLFMTEAAFLDFSRKTQITIEDIRTELTKKQYLENTQFSLQVTNSERITLMALTVPDEWSLLLESKQELSEIIEVI